MDKVFFLIIGFLINAGLLYLISKTIKNFILLRWLCTYLPVWIGGTLSFILLVGGGFISACMVFRFGGLVYEAIEVHDMILLAQYIVADILCMIYLHIITNKLK